MTAHHIINLVKREGDSDVTTGSEKLKFLTYGAPTMRYILYQIHTYVLPHTITVKPRKLLITGDVPLNAFFWDSVCNFAYVETEVLNAGLTDLKRVNLVKRFNDSKVADFDNNVSGVGTRSKSGSMLLSGFSGNASHQCIFRNPGLISSNSGMLSEKSVKFLRIDTKD